MALYVLTDDATGTVAEAVAPIINVKRSSDKQTALVGVSIPTTGTVSIRGRTSDNMPWVELVTKTASALVACPITSQMICVVSAHGGGNNIRVELKT